MRNAERVNRREEFSRIPQRDAWSERREINEGQRREDRCPDFASHMEVAEKNPNQKLAAEAPRRRASVLIGELILARELRAARAVPLEMFALRLGASAASFWFLLSLQPHDPSRTRRTSHATSNA